MRNSGATAVRRASGSYETDGSGRGDTGAWCEVTCAMTSPRVRLGENHCGSTTRPGNARLTPPNRSVIMIELNPRSPTSVCIAFSAAAGNPLTRATSARTLVATSPTGVAGTRPGVRRRRRHGEGYSGNAVGGSSEDGGLFPEERDRLFPGGVSGSGVGRRVGGCGVGAAAGASSGVQKRAVVANSYPLSRRRTRAPGSWMSPGGDYVMRARPVPHTAIAQSTLVNVPMMNCSDACGSRSSG